ncbi:aldehyde dehydrogenase family protein [Affinibrenneria salicis]|uniref:Aldehyde dehydrogenase family protein n=1 Tax=Affinibrenneria salicis TaxID=2590031 RepID=A0A5J5FWV4_9GAMM|nr:aldehyde dehydrogenase family protein [Affinibrenneria salicis]KAA8998428.1 aldehyde dehydrogenase family protein [Affinibrenneria salicis]
MTGLKTAADWQASAQRLRFSSGGFIDGDFRTLSGRELISINPATEQVLAAFPAASEANVDTAARAARHAFDDGGWPRMAPQQRAVVIKRLAALMQTHQDQLALIDTLDMGKPIAESAGFDIPQAIAAFQHAAEALDKRYDELAPSAEDVQVAIRREPIGVVAAIVPWNYPLLMAAWKVAPALAAGNCVILKPSEKSPLSALLLARLAAEAGVPPGVFQVLPGYGDEVGKCLALHHDVDCLAFTGSTRVAGMLQVYAGSSNLKRVWCEAGGKNPSLIFDDASLPSAADISALAIYSNQGEVCIAASRLYLHQPIADEFLTLFDRAAAAFVPGDPLDPATRLGPLVDADHLARVQGFIQRARAGGLKIRHGGEPVKVDGKGFYMRPCSIEDVPPQAEAMTEEIFGPVVALARFADEAEALRLANNTRYGLGACLWSNNPARINRLTRRLKSGLIWVNTWGEGDVTVPFGGMKASGNGRDKSLHAFDKYTDLKTIWQRFPADEG